MPSPKNSLSIYTYVYIYITFYFPKDFQKCQLGSYRLSSLERNLKDDLFQHPLTSNPCLIYSQCCSSFAWIFPMIKLVIPKANILDRSNDWESFFSIWPETNRYPFSHYSTSYVWRQLPCFSLSWWAFSSSDSVSSILYLKICQPLYFPCSVSCWPAPVFGIHLKNIIPRMTLITPDAELPL